MSYIVRFSPAALDQLEAIEDYITYAGAAIAAARYVEAIVAYCESLTMFPLRGVARDDLLTGLRITHYEGSAVVAFIADANSETVSILGVFYGGQDYESALQDMQDD